eukprot:PITA_14540
MDIGRRGRGRGARRMADEALREELRVLTARLEVVEAGRRRDPELGDVSEEEVEVAADGAEEISEDCRVKFAATKLKGHATLWWDSVQNERKRLNKPPIKTWTRMVAKLKGRFLPRDYQIALHRQVHNLRQRGLTVKEYTEEFYRVNLRAGYTEDTAERTARYVNGLKMEILDEISILSPNNTEEAYQSAVKAKEKLNEDRMPGEDKGLTEEEASPMVGAELPATAKKPAVQGLREQQKKEMEREVADRFSAAEEMAVEGELVTSATDATKEAAAPPQEAENAPETGEALVLHKVLLKPVDESIEQTQRKALFRTVCKSQGKCCKMIIDSGSTDNLVSVEMVEKLGLKRLKHPNPYRVSWLQKGHQLLIDE